MSSPETTSAYEHTQFNEIIMKGRLDLDTLPNLISNLLKENRELKHKLKAQTLELTRVQIELNNRKISDQFSKPLPRLLQSYAELEELAPRVKRGIKLLPNLLSTAAYEELVERLPEPVELSMGERYQGEVDEDGLPHGYGICLGLKSGQIFEGVGESGKPSYVTFYEGYWKHGRCHGKGRRLDSKAKLWYGEWSEGRFEDVRIWMRDL